MSIPFASPINPPFCATNMLRRALACLMSLFASALMPRLALLACAALLTACGSLPVNVPRTASHHLEPVPDGTLTRIARASLPSADVTGFRLMPLGVYSLDARVQLMLRAEHTLDVQYYVIEDDSTGQLLISGLRDAARRGVRVRLLVDDLYTARTQDWLRALAALPNVEVRLFNPFCCGRNGLLSRFIASPGFSRLNHRMHNKLFIADGVMAVAGGRNIADEYFSRNPVQNFVDLDAFMVGAVVPQLETIFDRYWASEPAYPIQALVPAGPGGMEQDPVFREMTAMPRMTPPLDLPPVDVLGYGPISEELDSGQIGMVYGVATAFADPPDKVMKEDAADAVSTSVTMNVLDLVAKAQSEVVLTSPYLIPGTRGMALINALHARGVKQTVLTNSLAANDEPLVHTGYARYRVGMLKAGVDLYELSPARTVRNKRLDLSMFGSRSLGRLHAKTLIIDRRTVFIGSMNLDPRSASKNTELGVIVDSPALAKEMLRIINISKLQSAYRVRLAADGSGLEWLSADDDNEVVLTGEPESSFLMRLEALILSPLVPEELL